MRKFVTDIENNGTEAETPPFSSEFLGRSPPSIWGFRMAALASWQFTAAQPEGQSWSVANCSPTR
jgi:hypothetical protein